MFKYTSMGDPLKQLTPLAWGHSTTSLVGVAAKPIINRKDIHAASCASYLTFSTSSRMERSAPHHAPQKWPKCGASAAGQIHATRPNVIALFSMMLRGMLPTGADRMGT